MTAEIGIPGLQLFLAGQIKVQQIDPAVARAYVAEHNRLFLAAGGGGGRQGDSGRRGKQAGYKAMARVEGDAADIQRLLREMAEVKGMLQRLTIGGGGDGGGAGGAAAAGAVPPRQREDEPPRQREDEPPRQREDEVRRDGQEGEDEDVGEDEGEGGPAEEGDGGVPPKRRKRHRGPGVARDPLLEGIAALGAAAAAVAAAPGVPQMDGGFFETVRNFLAFCAPFINAPTVGGVQDPQEAQLTVSLASAAGPARIV
jgi:hypothetical protein